MKSLPLSTVAKYAGGKLVSGPADRFTSSVSTDSRNILPGSVFVALRGEKFDGHAFVKEVAKGGAIAAIVDTLPENYEQLPIGMILVEDTLKGLQNLAANYRLSLKAKVVGITGSSGKSSAKEMIASVLGTKFSVQKTKGNFNNHIGVPLTLLSASEEHQWIVVEMGTNHPGEIAPLAGMSRPEVGVMLNIGWGHIEAFGSQEAIAGEKGALVRALPANGFAILNSDDPLVVKMKGWTNARAVLAGESVVASYRFENIRVSENSVSFTLISPEGKAETTLPVAAPHMVSNAILAAAVGGELGIPLQDISRGLADTQLMGGRSQVQRVGKALIVDDTYNANPSSMVAGMVALKNLPGAGRMVALLGAMGELGTWSEKLHRGVGAEAAKLGFGLIYAVGDDGKFIVEEARKCGAAEKSTRWFASHEELNAAYAAEAMSDDKILVKGSRSQRMEKVVQFIKEGNIKCFTI